MIKRLRNIVVAASASIMLVIAAVVTAMFSPVRAAAADKTYSRWDGDLVAAGWGVAGIDYSVDYDEWRADRMHELATSGEYVVNTSKEEITIGSAAGFAFFSHEIYLDPIVKVGNAEQKDEWGMYKHSLDGYTVYLDCNIDLDNKLWVPIGDTNRKSDAPNKKGWRFSGTFDGRGHEIKNFNGSAYIDNVRYNSSEPSEQKLFVDYTYTVGSTVMHVAIPCNGDYCQNNTKSDKITDSVHYEITFGIFADTYKAIFKGLSVTGVNILFDTAPLKKDLTDDVMTVEVVDTIGGGGIHKNVNVYLVGDSVGTIAGYNLGGLQLINCTAGTANSNDRLFTEMDAYVSKGVSDRSLKEFIKPSLGGLVGRIYGVPSDKYDRESVGYPDVTVDNCVNNVSIKYYSAGCKASGFIGYTIYALNYKLNNCVNNADIEGPQFAGGILGYTQYSLNNTYWHLEITNCENYGHISGDRSQTDSSVGGIAGHIGNCDSKALSGNADATHPEDIRYIGTGTYKIENCRNYGEVSDCIHVGGIAGYWGVSDKAANNMAAGSEIKNCYNYGYVHSTDVANSRAGGIVGLLSVRHTNNTPLSKDATLSAKAKPAIVSACANAGEIADAKSMSGGVAYESKDAGTTYTKARIVDAYKDIRTENATGDTVATKTVVFDSKDSTKIVGVSGVTDNSKFRISIPAKAVTIADGAFAGMVGLTEVSFASDGALKKIGDFAFAGTGVKYIAIPAGVTEIGAGAFSQTDLMRVSIPSSVKTVGARAFANLNTSGDKLTVNVSGNTQVTYGDSVFCTAHGSDTNNAYIVAENRSAYDRLYNSAAYSEFKTILTYPVKLIYNYLGVEIDSELRLYANGYGVALNDSDVWVSDTSALGTSKTITAGIEHWYASETSKTVITKEDVAKLINQASGDYINIYTFDKKDQKVYVARDNIVYDGKAYALTELNSLLHSSSDKITPLMTVTITAFKDADGNAATKVPTSVCEAGTYTISVDDGNEEQTFELKVARKLIDVGDSANNTWSISSVAGEPAKSDFRNQVIYVYTFADSGKEYPSNSILPAEEVKALGLNSEYTMRNVRYSAVRYRGAEITVGLSRATSGEFTVTYTGNKATEIGTYSSTATLTADHNCTFVRGSLTDASARGISVTVSGDGRTAQITKIWYVINVGNWAVAPSGADYGIISCDYGASNTSVIRVPRLMYGDVDSAHYGDDDDPVRLTLKYGSQIVGEEFFKRDMFEYYINNAMPAGSYTLIITAEALTTQEPLENDPNETISIYHDGFTETVTFTVTKAPIPEAVLSVVDTTLRGSVYKYEWDGTSHLYDSAAQQAINAAFEYAVNADRINTVWANVSYNSLYSVGFEVMFNLSLMQSDTYYPTANLPVSLAAAPGRYVVFYKVSALNYLDSTDMLSDNETRTDSFFEVRIVREVTVPTLQSKIYDGNALKAEIPESEFYTVVDYNGFVDVNNHQITLTLRDPEFYYWRGQEIGEADCKVTFTITPAINKWIVEPNLVPWLEDNYDASVNKFVGAAKFGNIVYTVTSLNKDKVYFDESRDINELAKLAAGDYLLTAKVEGSANYNELVYTAHITIIQKEGIPGWLVFVIVLCVLLVVAAVIFILYKKGVFTILTHKITVAIRTRATVEATIASVRAIKMKEDSEKALAEAEKREKLLKRREARKAAAAKTAEEKAATAEEQAKAAMERLEKMRARAEAMQLRAEKLRERIEAEKAEGAGEDKEQAPAEPEIKAAAANEPAVTETPAKAEPVAEAPAKTEPAAEEPAKAEPAAEEPAKAEPAAEAPAEEKPAKSKSSKKKQTKKAPEAETAEAAATEDKE